MGLQIDENPTKVGTINTRTQKRALDAGEKAEAASKRPNVDQPKVNTNNQRIVYINFEGERPRLYAFANQSHDQTY